jgi:hypothetical protein
MGSGSNPSIKDDLFSAQRSPDTLPPSADQPKSSHPDETAVASSQSYALPQNLPSALSHLNDDQLDRLHAAVMAEQQRRGKTLPVTIETSRKQRTKEASPPLAQGKWSLRFLKNHAVMIRRQPFVNCDRDVWCAYR